MTVKELKELLNNFDDEDTIQIITDEELPSLLGTYFANNVVNVKKGIGAVVQIEVN